MQDDKTNVNDSVVDNENETNVWNRIIRRVDYIKDYIDDLKSKKKTRKPPGKKQKKA